MSANSIAKLAVVITGDSAPLNQAMNQGSQHIREFAHEVQHVHGGALGTLANGFRVGVQGMHAFEGSTRGIIHTLHNLSGPGGAALVAAAGFAFLGYEALKAANHAAEARNKIREEYDKAFEAVHGQKSGVQMEDTIGGSWKEAKEAIEDFFATLGENSGLVEATISLFKGLAESVKEWANYWKTDIQKAREKEIEATKKRIDVLKEVKKQQEENQKKAEEAEKAIQRQMEETRKHAERLTQSLRLPDEIYRDTIVELKNLAAQGLLTGETLSRGMQKASDDLQRATDSAKEMRDVTNQRVGAAERGTMAGFSAVQAARSAQENALAADAKKTAKNSDFLKHLESIDKNIAESKTAGPTFVMSNL